MHACTHTCACLHLLTSQSKAYGSYAKQNYYCPANQHWDVCVPLRHWSVVQANPPGAGLVTHRWFHRERSWNPKFHNDLNSTIWDKGSWAFATPVNTKVHIRYPLMLQLGGLLPPVDARPPGPHSTAGQTEQSFVLKDTMTPPKQPNWESNPGPLNMRSMPWPLGYAAPHTNMLTRTCTHLLKYTHIDLSMHIDTLDLISCPRILL